MSVEQPSGTREPLKANTPGEKWVALGTRTPRAYLELTRKSGEPFRMMIVRKLVPGANKIEYYVYRDKRTKILGRTFEQTLKEKDQIAWFYPSEIDGVGKVQITNARIFDVSDRREGVGTAVYDLIEQDIKAAGGVGLEPMLGAMSDDAIEFWKDRRPEEADVIEKKGRKRS